MLDLAGLFDDHYQSLFRYLVRLSGDGELAADAVQEAFLRLVERPPPRGGGERAWLFTVATNVVFEITRTRARQGRLLAATETRIPIGDPPRDPHELLESQQRRQLVSNALATLSEKERTALLMREEGFSHREIAEAVGTTTGSVGTLIARALDKLAGVLALDRESV